jgi:hypothetical protein
MKLQIKWLIGSIAGLLALLIMIGGVIGGPGEAQAVQLTFGNGSGSGDFTCVRSVTKRGPFTSPIVNLSLILKTDYANSAYFSMTRVHLEASPSDHSGYERFKEKPDSEFFYRDLRSAYLPRAGYMELQGVIEGEIFRRRGGGRSLTGIYSLDSGFYFVRAVDGSHPAKSYCADPGSNQTQEVLLPAPIRQMPPEMLRNAPVYVR